MDFVLSSLTVVDVGVPAGASWTYMPRLGTLEGFGRHKPLGCDLMPRVDTALGFSQDLNLPVPAIW
jgi:hypothetical protein